MTDGADGRDADPLVVDGDDLAGVVDLFGGLTRAELRRALSELAFRQGAGPPEDGVVDEAIANYAIVEYGRTPDEGAGPDDDASTVEGAGPDEGEGKEELLLVPGPASFPRLPEGAADLPHIMEVEQRTIDRESLGRAVERRFRGEVARAVDAENGERIERLQDVSYDLEAWGPVDLDRLRERLDVALGRELEE